MQILGINEVGHASGNESMCEGRDLPWLQDTVDEAVWTRWDPVYRDVIVLDGDNHPVGAYNLTDNDLSDPGNEQALVDLLVDSAS